MSRKAKVEITAEGIRKAIEDSKFSSLTGLAHSLGYKGSVSSSLTKKLRGLLPDIDSLLAANKPIQNGKADAGTSGNAPKAKTVKPTATAKGGKTKLPLRHPQNPYRPGSAYGCVLDLLARQDVLGDGINRLKLVEQAAAATGKDLKRAGFDVIVVCSPEGTSPTCHRHRSAREGYGIEKKNGWVRLTLPPAAAKVQS